MEGYYAPGIAKGVAPKARIAIYKVCWRYAGCFDSDILTAFDVAITDGVDIIFISIGGGDGVSSPYYLDPIAIGAYGAVSRGVFMSSSAGNDGPNGMSVTNLAPWLTTIGASTIDRNFPAEIILDDGRKFSGVLVYAGALLDGKMYPLVYPSKSRVLSTSLCMSQRSSGEKGWQCWNDSGEWSFKWEGLVRDANLLPACAIGSSETMCEILKFIENSTKTILSI